MSVEPVPQTTMVRRPTGEMVALNELIPINATPLTQVYDMAGSGYQTIIERPRQSKPSYLRPRERFIAAEADVVTPYGNARFLDGWMASHDSN